jgi:hypothetical protein
MTLPESLRRATFTPGPGATWHSAIGNDAFDPNECFYVRGTPTSNNGSWCKPSLTFKRVMVSSNFMLPIACSAAVKPDPA